MTWTVIQFCNIKH